MFSNIFSNFAAFSFLSLSLPFSLSLFLSFPLSLFPSFSLSLSLSLSLSPSPSLSRCLFLCLFLLLSFPFSLSLSLCLFLFLVLFVSLSLFFFLFFSLSLSLDVSVSVSFSLCLSLSLSLSLFLSLSLSLPLFPFSFSFSVCLWLSPSLSISLCLYLFHLTLLFSRYLVFRLFPACLSLVFPCFCLSISSWWLFLSLSPSLSPRLLSCLCSFFFPRCSHALTFREAALTADKLQCSFPCHTPSRKHSQASMKHVLEAPALEDMKKHYQTSIAQRERNIPWAPGCLEITLHLGWGAREDTF